MKPKCFNCGKFVTVGKGETARLEVSDKYKAWEKDVEYLCGRCIPDNLESFKTYPWVKAVTII